MFLNIENKEDTAEKIAAAQGKPSKHFYWANEFNLLRDAINTLRWLISLNENNISAILSSAPKVELGTIVGSYIDNINERESIELDSGTFITFTLDSIFYVKAFTGTSDNYGIANGLKVDESNFLPIYQSDEQITQTSTKIFTLSISLEELALDDFDGVKENLCNYISNNPSLIPPGVIPVFEILEKPKNVFEFVDPISIANFINYLGFTPKNLRVVDNVKFYFDNEDYDFSTSNFNDEFDEIKIKRIVSSCSEVVDDAFNYCRFLNFIEMPKCTIIGQQAFGFSNNLSRIILPECLSIGNWAFYQDESPRKYLTIHIPKIEQIGTSTGSNNVFFSYFGSKGSIVINPNILSDGDIKYLINNNPLSGVVTDVQPEWPKPIEKVFILDNDFNGDFSTITENDLRFFFERNVISQNIQSINWGDIIGLISNQQDLIDALALKRDVADLKQLSAEHVLLNQVALQSLGFTHNVVPGTYELYLSANLTNLASSGNIQFGVLGSASVTSINGKSQGNKQNSFPTTSQMQDINSVNATAITSASASTIGNMELTARITFLTSGTFIPSVGFSSAPSSGRVSIGSFSLLQKI